MRGLVLDILAFGLDGYGVWGYLGMGVVGVRGVKGWCLTWMRHRDGDWETRLERTGLQVAHEMRGTRMMTMTTTTTRTTMRRRIVDYH